MTEFVPVPGISYASCAFPNPEGTVAVCTLWEPVERAVERYPDAGIVGPCVSPAGVDYVVRTLGANPHLTQLVIRGPDLSGTYTLLEDALYPKALDVGWGLHREHGREVQGPDPRAGDIAVYFFDPAREAVIDPVPPPPPGTVGTRRGPPARSFVGASLFTVWPRLLGEVVRHGAESPTAYGSRQRELLAVSWTFGVAETLTGSPPQWLPDAIFQLGGGTRKTQLDEYAAVHFLGGPCPNWTEEYRATWVLQRPEGVAYTYADRLRRAWDDQIERCIETLRADPEQRRAWASTWFNGEREVYAPGGMMFDSTERAGRPSDAAGRNPPCLVGLWFRRDEDGTLYTHATFRSHDLLQAGVPNAWGLCRLAEYVAETLGWPVGKLTVCSLSGHIYEQGFAQAEQIAQERGRGAAYEEDDRAILRVRRSVVPAPVQPDPPRLTEAETTSGLLCGVRSVGGWVCVRVQEVVQVWATDRLAYTCAHVGTVKQSVCSIVRWDDTTDAPATAPIDARWDWYQVGSLTGADGPSPFYLGCFARADELIRWSDNPGQRDAHPQQIIAVDLLLPDGSTADTIEGRTAEAVEREVLERGWVSVLSHAAFLGRALAQAERQEP